MGRTKAKKKDGTFPIRSYVVGDLVYAQVRGFSPWPAYVTEVLDKENKPSEYNVLFYGTYEKSTVRATCMFRFHEDKQMMGANKLTKALQSAIHEAETEPGNILASREKREEAERKVAIKRKASSSSRVVKKKPKLIVKKRCYDPKIELDQAPRHGAMMKSTQRLVGQSGKMKEKFVFHKGIAPGELYSNHLDLVPETTEEFDFIDIVETCVDEFESDIFSSPVPDSVQEKLPVLQSAIKKLRQKPLKNSDVVLCLQIVAACEPSSRADIIIRILSHIKSEADPSALRDVVLETELPELSKKIVTEQEVQNLDQLMRKSLNLSTMVMPWVATQSDFLESFCTRSPTPTERLLYFRSSDFFYKANQEEDDVRIKYFPAESLAFMRSAQENLDCVPEYFEKVLKLAKKSNPDMEEYVAHDAAQKSRLLENEIKLRKEIKSIVSSLEMNEPDVNIIIKALEVLNSLKTTKIMWFKNPGAVQTIFYLSSGSRKMKITSVEEELEQIESIAHEVYKNVKSLILPDKIEASPNSVFSALKKGHLKVVCAAEANRNVSLCMTEEPVALELTHSERSDLAESIRMSQCSSELEEFSVLKQAYFNF